MDTRVLIACAALAASAACGGSSTPAAPSANVPYSSTDLRAGDGTTAITGSLVEVNYTGWLYDAAQPDHKGRQFDTTSGKSSFSFYLGASQVIRGWDLGVPGMKVGGLRRLVIPPDLGYGGQTAGNGAIPPNSTLVFEIELLNVQ
jgi:FKBP-type peptidyl-prolyl cis-trans isomerase FkpA